MPAIPRGVTVPRQDVRNLRKDRSWCLGPGSQEPCLLWREASSLPCCAQPAP